MTNRTYVLGGTQSDFSRYLKEEGKTIFDLFSETLAQAFEEVGIDATEVQRCHIGNTSGDILNGFSQMGGFFGMANDALAGVPASRHEAGCCAGSMAFLGGYADITAGFYNLVLVAGIESMNTDPADMQELMRVDQALGTHAWPTERGHGTVWPYLFSKFQEDYMERYALDYRHLGEISRINLNNAQSNPNARSKGYPFTDECFTQNDNVNPVLLDGFRIHDVCPSADGAAFVFLADEQYAKKYADRQGLEIGDIPYVKGFGHTTMPTELDRKRRISDASGSPYYMPHLHKTIQTAITRAGFNHVKDLDVMELHDCFSVAEYMLLDHCGFEAPGEAWKIIEDGTIKKDGGFPVNPSGGLIGGGHPVGCTGVRMVLDCYKQVAGKAGKYQIEGAKNAITFNIGGTVTTAASIVIGV